MPIEMMTNPSENFKSWLAENNIDIDLEIVKNALNDDYYQLLKELLLEIMGKDLRSGPISHTINV